MCGFRTYKEKTVINFTRGINCIVGFNGSGKSNILLALEFILGDVNTKKIKYTHEGFDCEVKSAYVEVVFDNTKKYFSMFRQDEVTVRKVLENRKCQIFVNDKKFSKFEYIEMLESCGLCVSNLYNIIKQGHLIKLSNMQDEDILRYLKSILGAKMFEDKKKDALNLLRECKTQKSLTEKDFEELHEKIEQIKKDNEKYEVYEKLENERLYLEYYLTKLYFTRLMKKSEKTKKKIAILNEEAEAADLVLSGFLEKKSDLMEEINKLKLEICSYKNALDVQVSEEMQNERNIVHIQILLDEKKQEKNKIINEDKKRFAERQEINEYISVINEKIGLFNRAIATKETALKNKRFEIDKILSTSNKGQEKKEDYVDDVKKLEIMLKDIDVEISSIEHEMFKTLQLLERLEGVYNGLLAESKQNTSLSEKCDARLRDLAQQTEECVEKKRQKQQEIVSLTTQLNTVKGQLIESREKYEETLKSTQKEVKKLLGLIMEEPSIEKEGVYGLLIDNIKVEKTYMIAVDAVLEHYYFYLIVKDAKTAKSIIKFIDKKREEQGIENTQDSIQPPYCENFIFGKIVIVPIDRIKKYDDFDYPDDENIIPLIECIEYDDRISDYIKFILYKTIAVRSLDYCKRYFEEKYTCVDLDGDYMSGMGYIYGGYTKRKYSLYGLNSKVKNLEKEEEIIKGKIEECYNTIEKIEDELREFYNKKAIVLAQKNGCDTRLSSLENTGKSNEEYIRVSDVKLTALKAKKKSLEEYKRKLYDQIKFSKKKIDDFNKFSGKTKNNEREKEEEKDEDKNNINNLTDDVKKLKEEILNLQHKQDEYKNKLELLYNKKIESDSYIFFSDAGDADIEEYSIQLKEKENLRNIITEKKKGIEKKIEEINNEKEKLKKEVDKILVEEKKQKKKILDLCHQINKLNAEIRVFDFKESELRDKKSRLERNATDGEQYKHLNEAQMKAKLKAVNLELKKYIDVTPKPGPKLNRVIADFNELKKRHSNIESSYTTIKKMIQEIAKIKDESLESNFEKINKYFTEFFSMLFKNKKAHLVLNKMSEEEYNTKLQEQKKKRKLFFGEEAYVDKLTGISVEIFSSEEETHYYSIQELSGGERTIVTLCLLLCLNKIDNCSFFFFDEVDAALDTIHRDNLSLLIKELSEQGTQFIITTFRRELLQYCDNLYIVSLIYRESQIEKGTKEEAYKIITLEEKRAFENKGNDIDLHFD